MKAIIHFDGGCSPNPGNKYGSYSISLDEFEIRKQRFNLGHGTNNEAEFESLLTALDELLRATLKTNISSKVIHVNIFTDSTIVRNWINNFERFKPHKCKNERRLAMGGLAGKCVKLLKYFHSFTIEWRSRDENVARFGH